MLPRQSEEERAPELVLKIRVTLYHERLVNNIIQCVSLSLSAYVRRIRLIRRVAAPSTLGVGTTLPYATPNIANKVRGTPVHSVHVLVVTLVLRIITTQGYFNFT